MPKLDLKSDHFYRNHPNSPALYLGLFRVTTNVMNVILNALVHHCFGIVQTSSFYFAEENQIYLKDSKKMSNFKCQIPLWRSFKASKMSPSFSLLHMGCIIIKTAFFEDLKFLRQYPQELGGQNCR